MVGKRILFLCDRNTVRSPMAASMVKGATSAGLDADNAVEPFACAVMLEDGIDITAHTPVTINPKALKPDTHVVALSMPAFEAARKWREKAGFELDYWDLPQVPPLEGPRDTIMDGFRALREALKLHIRNRFAKS
jgi:protein-tyrosine-phosphatase